MEVWNLAEIARLTIVIDLDTGGFA